MSKPRKTIDISEVRRMGNHFLQHSEDHQATERRATANFLESILSHSGNYKGFMYLSKEDESRRLYG